LPPARIVVISKSLSSMAMSISSSMSGVTSIAAKLVCRRALPSKGLMRTSRCTPTSARR